ncbi:unnamed protein product [Urochloa humidicola]
MPMAAVSGGGAVGPRTRPPPAWSSEAPERLPWSSFAIAVFIFADWTVAQARLSPFPISCCRRRAGSAEPSSSLLCFDSYTTHKIL